MPQTINASLTVTAGGPPRLGLCSVRSFQGKLPHVNSTRANSCSNKKQQRTAVVAQLVGSIMDSHSESRSHCELFWRLRVSVCSNPGFVQYGPAANTLSRISCLGRRQNMFGRSRLTTSHISGDDILFVSIIF